MYFFKGTYWQKLYTIVSKTSVGPVGPKIVKGCPEKRPYATPTAIPPIKASITEMWFSVASPSNPPKVTVGAKMAKYMKIIDANDCNENPSTKSDA